MRCNDEHKILKKVAYRNRKRTLTLEQRYPFLLRIEIAVNEKDRYDLQHQTMHIMNTLKQDKS